MQQPFEPISNELYYAPRPFDAHANDQDASTDPIVLTAYRSTDPTLTPPDPPVVLETPTTPSNPDTIRASSITTIRAKIRRVLHNSMSSSRRPRLSGSSLDSISERFLMDDTLWNRMVRAIRKFVVANLRWIGLSVAVVVVVAVMVTFLVMLDDPR
ncbi:hypothetical protein IWW45_002462 [Coemansia sp. RSA 485]|nr:hypothetical protein IWW45_002462 [Coemansia sp. RSA 485]